jgi:hypothetical protein
MPTQTKANEMRRNVTSL